MELSTVKAIKARTIPRSPKHIPSHAPFRFLPQHIHLPFPPQILCPPLPPPHRIPTPRPRHPNRLPTRLVYSLPPSPRSQNLQRNSNPKPSNNLQLHDPRPGYSNNSMILDVVNIFREMQRGDRLAVNFVTMLSLVSGCTLPNHLTINTSLHGCAIMFGFDSFLTVANSFLTMYVKCGEVKLARKLFDEMSVKNLITWNAMISGYAQNGHAGHVLELYREMKKLNGVSPDAVSLLGVLCSCANLGAQGIGREAGDRAMLFSFESVFDQ